MERMVKQGRNIALWTLATVLAFGFLLGTVFLCREAMNPAKYSDIIKYLDNRVYGDNVSFVYSYLGREEDAASGWELRISLNALSDYFEQGFETTVNPCKKKAVPEDALRFQLESSVPDARGKKYTLTVYTELDYIEFYDESAGVINRLLCLKTDCSNMLKEIVVL